MNKKTHREDTICGDRVIFMTKSSGDWCIFLKLVCGDWNFLLSLQHKCCETAHARQSMLTSLSSLNRSFDSHKQRVLWKKDCLKERFTLNC